MTHLSSTFAWPVRWDIATALGAEREADELARSPLLAAHRVLDRLAAMAFDAVDGAFGATDAFVDALTELRRTVPDLAPGTSGEELRPTGASLRTTLAVDAVDDKPAAASAASTSGSLIDVDGVNNVVEVALRLAGRLGAHTIRRLSEVAVMAERRLPGKGYPQDAGYLADVSVLTGNAAERDTAASPATDDQTERTWWSPRDRTDVVALVRAAPPHCSTTYLQVDENDLVLHPPPEGEALSTAGIEQVEVTQPCGASPVMTIRGHGFGSAHSGGGGVIAAGWEGATAQVVYRTVSVSSWSDTKVVAQLPGNVISGYAAFADLDFIARYNKWVQLRNKRVTEAMHVHGCPGDWKPELPYAETPGSVPAARYSAGMPRVLADVAPTSGSSEQWNARTLHLQTGQAFRVAWQGFGAKTMTLRALDSGAQTVLANAGHSGPVTGLNASSGKLVLTAPATPVRATFAVEAGNSCGTSQARVAVMVTGPALQSASVAVYQAVAGGDVSVTVGGAGEVLNPATGSSIPLVAAKRSVAVIDWWSAVPQMPPGETLTAKATLEVHGPLLSFPGVTLRPSVSTADPAPPDPPLELPSGPAFTSLTAYQQWLAMGNNPQTFNVVLPAEVCRGGEIPGTHVQGWTRLDATVRVSSEDGPSWTVKPGTNVTFYPRRKVRIRYRAWGTSTQSAPTDQVCRAALRAAGSLLPMPDPEIFVLSGSPTQQNGHLIEDLIAERGGTETPSWRDEIWLVIGPVGMGGYAPGPWVGASDATEVTIAHEVGHLFAQNHLALCGIVGDPPSSFPNGGNVVVPGFDMWNSAFVRNARDVMVRTYCPEPTWPSPERWRREFLQVGRS
ncbi:hypothetical protein ACFCYC_22370 [Streptomyces sp. NPDC056402]|uniref:hypothetical protein n=1 Tax=Streptomyces sp. NPDC056402 TaxID=3345810 RepID=UPI0035E299E9